MSQRSDHDEGDDPHAALASPTRRRLLELLRAGDSPRDVHDLAQATGLHRTTVRFHLEMLQRAGLVRGQPCPRSGVGRPRTVYAPVSRGGAGHSDAYRRLAGLLAAHLGPTAEARAFRAEQAGVDWATHLVPAVTADRPSPHAAARQVGALFTEMGFEPDLTTEGHDLQIRLLACPFREVAREQPEVVCAMHLGLLRGSLAQLGVTAPSWLRPFVEPELCLAGLSSHRQPRI